MPMTEPRPCHGKPYSQRLGETSACRVSDRRIVVVTSVKWHSCYGEYPGSYESVIHVGPKLSSADVRGWRRELVQHDHHRWERAQEILLRLALRRWEIKRIYDFMENLQARDRRELSRRALA